MRRAGAAAAGLLAAFLLAREAVADCIGDCNNDGITTVGEVVLAVRIALGNAAINACPGLAASSDGRVTIDELLRAVSAARIGCAAMPTPTQVTTITPTARATPTATATPVSILIPPLAVYYSYPGFPIRRGIGAIDTRGSKLRYAAQDVPQGAALDADTGVLTWTPADNQTGPFYVPFSVEDDAAVPAVAHGALAFQIEPLDACSQPSCDPASGCQSAFVPLTQACCAQAPQVRVPEAVALCPGGADMFAGRNITGFGRLQNCDRLQVVHSAQISAVVSFNVEARCLDTTRAVDMYARLEAPQRVVFDGPATILLRPRPDGYAQQLGVSFPVNGPRPYFDLEGAQADLSISLTDAEGVTVSTKLRLVLTFAELADLPDLPPPG